MSVESFVDTNILLYAHDREAGSKNTIAAETVKRIWDDRSGAVSTQVLQEFYVNLRKRTRPALSSKEARQIVEDYLAWHVETITPASILRASDLEARYRISFWDAMIVESAMESGAEILLTEDLNHGQRYGTVLARNPFLT
jgi:predicted nucleic acid-binding protein